MISIIIFSKNRPMQFLYCTETTMRMFGAESSILALIKADEKYKKAYEKLGEFLYEDDFQKDVKGLTREIKSKYIMFLCDDDCFINPVYNYAMKNMLLYFEEHTEVHSFSLRMNPKIDYCFPAKKSMEAPPIKDEGEFMTWNWAEAEDQHTCWGYPFAINSHIYRTKDIVPLIQSIEFKNVNDLESQLNRRRMRDKPYMMSFKETKVFNVQNNFVKDEENHNDNPDKMSAEKMNEMFLAGKRITGVKNVPDNMCHGEVEYVIS